MDKRRIYSIIYLICLILLVNSLPFSLFIKDEVVLFIISLVIKIGSILYILYYIKKEELNSLKLDKPRLSHSKLLPLSLLCCSNFSVVIFQNSQPQANIDMFGIFSGLVIAIGVAIVEELLFRSQVLEEFLMKKNTISAIIYSSLIFGSVHLLNISSFASIPTVLVQACYTFFLGLVLGVVYTTTNNILFPIIFHFLFNFINDILIVKLFIIKWDLTFFIVNIVIGIVLFIYMLLLVIRKGADKNVTKIMDN